jgi:hypothetical protein
MSLGWYYLGNIEKTREYLAKAQQDGVSKTRITLINRDLAALIEPDGVNQSRKESN